MKLPKHRWVHVPRASGVPEAVFYSGAVIAFRSDGPAASELILSSGARLMVAMPLSELRAMMEQEEQ